MNIDLGTWEVVRNILTGLDESESNDVTKSQSIPDGLIQRFISEVDKELKFNGS